MSRSNQPRVAVDVRCEVGEGLIWHPQRATLIWVDVVDQVLYEADESGGAIRALGFGEPLSAVGLIDAACIAVVGASGLHRVDLDSGERSLLAPLEDDDPATRSNDARVGPGGAFWVGTMGRAMEAGLGALYRFSDGAFTRLRSGLTCPNCLAFSPDGTRAYLSDTFEHRILVYPLDPTTGAPTAEPDLFLDLSAEELCPDGAVVDVEGCLWNAQFGAGRVARYRPDGRFDRAIELPVSQTTCPAFGGADRKTLFVTTARIGLSEDERTRQPLAGAIFAVDVDVAGLPERLVAV